jgi:hypothetical protein
MQPPRELKVLKEMQVLLVPTVMLALKELKDLLV